MRVSVSQFQMSRPVSSLHLRRLLARDAKMTSPIVLLERQRRAMAEGLDGAERARLLERVHPSQRSAAQQLLDSAPTPR